MLTIYKVVIERDNLLRSVSIPISREDSCKLFPELTRKVPLHPFELHYQVNKVTIPPLDLKKAFIFVFETLQNAIDWVSKREGNSHTYKIYAGLTTEALFLESECASRKPDVMRNFWLEQEDVPLVPSPEGTMICPAVKLIRLAWAPANW